MFKKLISNLPYNPSLITQVGFYADRLRQEKSIRRLSFVFIALAMAVQSLAVISPPERSLAYSTNHIQNGVRTRDDILRAYDNNTNGIRDIYERFYISRSDIANLTSSPNTTIRSNDGNNYRTIGRTSLWSYSKVSSVYKESEIKIDHASGSVYNRELRAWDIVNPYNTYRAFKGFNTANNKPFWILVDCGNITWIPPYGQPPEPTPTPPPPVTPPQTPDPMLEIKKTITNSLDTVKPGDTFTYRIEYRNKVIGSVAKDVVIQDTLDIKNYAVVSPKGLNISGSGVLRFPVDVLKGSKEFSKLDLTVRLKDPIPSGERICNYARIEASNASSVKSKEVCIDVVTPCPYDPNVPNVNNPNCTEPVVSCKLIDSKVDLTLRKITFKTIVTSSNPANTQIKSYNYAFGDGSEQSFNSSELMHTTEHTYGPGEFEANATISYRTTGQEESTDKTKDCIGTIADFEEDREFVLSKTVSNITKGIDGEEAENTSVNAGDVLEYTLITANTNNFPRTAEQITDDIGDILDYATLDVAALEQTGGVFNEEQNSISWANVTIPANSEVKQVFRVQLLNPVPATNRPSATSGDYDCEIDNTYGNIVNMSVQCPAVKGIETLPNTGPGTSLIAVSGITVVIGYFFARSRLLAKEVDIIRTDYAMTGGA